MEELEFTYTPPLIGSGKHKNKLALMNTHHLWGPWYGTKIKSEFKDTLKEWYLPERNENPHHKATIHFTILRNNLIRIDADSMSYVNKWFLDTLTEQGYLVDDDKVRVILEPPILGLKSHIETQVKVTIFLEERYMVTLEELKTQAEQLNAEMQIFFSPQRTKAGSARIRKILGEIKNGVPELRRQLIAADKKK